MELIIPPHLQPGSLVGITCPAGYVSEARVAGAVQQLEQWGYRVWVGKTVGSGQHYFSGTDEERRADLQAMLNHPEVALILMGRGGYGMSRIIDALDFTAFVQKPKWICGFSDITVLLSHVQQQTGVACIHGPMCGAFTAENADAPHLTMLRNILCGADVRYPIPATPWNRNGHSKALVTGGNLAMLSHLVGSPSDVDMDGKLLFVEDIAEHLYKIDRMLYQLRRAGKLNKLAGLIVGQFSDVEDTERPFGQTLEAIISHHVVGYDFPVCFGFPAGHEAVNNPIVMGAIHTLEVTDTGATLTLNWR